MSITAWSPRLVAVGATPNEISAITSSYYATPQTVRDALDALVAGLANADLLTMLKGWRTSGGPFAASFPGGGLPFGTGAAVLTGNPADDTSSITAGTGRKMVPPNLTKAGVIASGVLATDLGGDAAGAAAAAQTAAENASVPVGEVGAAQGVGSLDATSRQPIIQAPLALLRVLGPTVPTFLRKAPASTAAGWATQRSRVTGSTGSAPGSASRAATSGQERSASA